MNTANNNKPTAYTKYIGLIVYTLTLVATCALLVVDPVGLDARQLIIPVQALLFIGAWVFFRRSTTRSFRITGPLALAVLSTLIGLFVIAAVAWFVAGTK